jgi:2-polyprenyl-3-methyl-5-hydroxy-6-metoxy-1,4-benzoquinol methylase
MMTNFSESRTTAFQYVGTELQLFKSVHNWKRYLSAQIEPFIRGDVLEVGAGIGSTTRVLFTPGSTGWTCLEPDASLSVELRSVAAELRDANGQTPRVVVGTLGALPEDAVYDTILYIDTLEHIEDDRVELATAATRLRPGGCILVLSPAHPWLYTPFDQAIGHFRRYTLASLQACSPPGVSLERGRYLDSVGIGASLANRLFMQASQPTPAQLAFWDRCLVPVSRIIDPLTGYRFGKSVIAIWGRAG